MNATKRSTAAISLLCFALLIATATGGAATIKGTAGKDTLRGGSAADRIDGRGGDDKLYGLAGNDVLVGGAGDDVLVGGRGSDTLTCGGGYDIARGDPTDRISRGCEVIIGVKTTQPVPPAPPPAPPPPPPPVSPVTAGNYQGQTQNGNFVFLTVSANRSFAGMRVNDLPAQCDGGGYLPGGEDFGDSVFRIRDDGTFDEQGSWDGSIVGGDVELTHWDGRVAGRFDTATSVSGTILMNYGLKYQGTALRCSSGEIRWTATLRP